MHKVIKFKNYRYKKRSTFIGNSRVYNGKTYDSTFEAQVAQDLDCQLEDGLISKWERQVKMDLSVYGSHICNYYVDFKVTYNDGSLEFIEVKGIEFGLWKFKWRLFEVLFNKEYPGVTLTVIK